MWNVTKKSNSWMAWLWTKNKQSIAFFKDIKVVYISFKQLNKVIGLNPRWYSKWITKKHCSLK